MEERLRRTIHFSELPPARPGDPLAIEYELYRREVARLLAEGNEGKWALIRGDEIVGIWETEADCDRTWLQRFPSERAFIHQIRAEEFVLDDGVLESRRFSEIAREHIRQVLLKAHRPPPAVPKTIRISTRLHKVSLSITDAQRSALFTHPTLLVMELSNAMNFDVLIGLDVLADCRFVLDGPAKQFSLEF